MGRLDRRAAGGLHRLRIAVKPRVRARLRSADAVTLALALSATDAAGNASQVDRRIVLRG